MVADSARYAAPSVPSDHLVLFTGSAAAGGGCLLGPVQGASREHSESDLRCYLAWYTGCGLRR
jgi:hypothetical protein